MPAAGAGRFAFLNIPQPVASADADFNRGVTRAEFAAAATDRFARIDAAQAGRGERAARSRQAAEDAGAGRPFRLRSVAPARPAEGRR